MIRVYSRFLIVLALVVAAFVPTAEAGALDPNVMRIVLHTATPQENGFIDYVVARVDNGTLPVGSGAEHVPLGAKEAAQEVLLLQAGLDTSGGSSGNHAVISNLARSRFYPNSRPA